MFCSSAFNSTPPTLSYLFTDIINVGNPLPNIAVPDGTLVGEVAFHTLVLAASFLHLPEPHIDKS